jgi:molybdopterin synthase catalytic subunit
MTIRIQHEDFDPGAEFNALKKGCGNAGAVVTFTGLVRDDGGITSMSLEHYPGMTEREIARHVEEAGARWPLLGITIVHRVGTLVPGDNIVLVAVAAAQRQAAFQAAQFLMDYLKTRAPFWKLEERTGESLWVDARESDEAAARRWRQD